MPVIAVLGASGSYPLPGEPGISILYDDGESRIVIDCGEGCAGTLTGMGYSPCDVDSIFLSHIHIDHWAGLPQLAVARVAEGCPSLELVAGIGVHDFWDMIRRTLPRSLGVRLFKAEAGRELAISKASRIRFFETTHTVHTLGVTVYHDSEKVVTYTSDTSYSDELALHAMGSKLLIAEATLPSSLSRLAIAQGHLTVSDLYRLAAETRPGLVLAVHLTPHSLKELASTRPPKGIVAAALAGSRIIV